MSVMEGVMQESAGTIGRTLNIIDDTDNLELSLQCKVEEDSGGGTESEVEDKFIPSQSKLSVDEHESITVKDEHIDSVTATDDESMAVEALRQLGGMYPEVDGAPDNNSPLLSCEQCGLQFHTSSECQKHSVAYHQPVNRFHVCSICGESFERKKDFENHLICHQVDRPHACKTCGNLFSRKADLKNHMVCHQVERPHRCSQCGIDFQRSSSLTNHMKIHRYICGRALNSGSVSVASPLSSKLQVPAHYNHMNETMQNISQLKSLTGRSNLYSDSQSEQNTIDNDNVQPVCDNWSDASQNVIESAEIPVDGTCETVSKNDQSEQLCHINDDNVNNVNSYADKRTNSETIEYILPEIMNISPADEISNQCDSAASNNNEKKTHEPFSMDDVSVKVESMPYSPMAESPPGQQESVNTSSNLRPHVCRHCGTGFARVTALQSHTRLHEDSWGSPLECDRCEEMFPEAFSLRTHQLTCQGKPRPEQHMSPQVINCSSQTSIAVQSSMNEGKTAPKVGKHVCSECVKRFTSKQKLFRHLWIHRKKLFVCEVCNLSLSNQDRLNEHRRTLHPGETPFVCKECGKSFASKQGMCDHSRLHGEGSASPFWCHKCNKNFASRQGYLIHTRTHTGERPYDCRYCWKAFRDSGTLRKHERIHTGERPHACPLCQRAFNQKVVLREHVRWVHAANRKGENPDSLHSFACQLCNEVLEDREALCAHIVKHSDKLAAIAKNIAAKEKQGVDKQNPVPVSEISKQKKVAHTKNKDPKSSKKKRSQTKKTKKTKKNQASTRLASGSADPSHSASDLNKCLHACGMCGDSFSTRTELVNHVRIHI